MFEPAFPIGEDAAAAGSATDLIACHLARHGRIEGWGAEIVISQGAEIDRPSTLYARAEGGGGLIETGSPSVAGQ